MSSRANPFGLLRHSLIALPDAIGSLCSPAKDPVDRDHVVAVARGTQFAMLGHVLNTTIAAVALREVAATTELIIWLLYSYGVAAYLLFRSVHRQKDHKKRQTGANRGARKATVFAALLAAPWAVLVMLFLGDSAQAEELIVITLAVGMAASGSVLLSPIRAAAVVYMATILVPTVLKCLVILEGTQYAPLGALAISYLLFLLGLINTSSKIFAEKTRAVRHLETSVTEITQAREEIERLAFADSLTGLANRRAFVEYLNTYDELDHSADPASLSVFYFDLDNFKQVNDTLGHHVGDDLLRLVGQRISKTIRPDDFAARLGGDEFVIVAQNMVNNDQAEKFAERLLHQISEPYVVHGQTVNISASVGIVFGRAHDVRNNRILRLADLAMYEAKAAGCNEFRMFNPAMQERAEAKRTIEVGLKRAVFQNEFELHFQPVYELSSVRLCGFEALVRWNHPQKGMLLPGEFVPVAEELGLIDGIGRWILREALIQAALWPQPLFVAVNLSPRQIAHSDIAQEIAALLDETGLRPERLELEVTETALLQDNSSVQDKLHSIKALGASIAIDDFGTGYSALSYLTSFPFDKIKIDRSFVEDICRRQENDAIIEAISRLADSLNYITVAEGVETIQQLQRLKALGVSQGQGFFFSKPRPAEEVLNLLSAGSTLACEGGRLLVNSAASQSSP